MPASDEFTQAVHEYQHRIRAFFMSRTGMRAASDDLTQETLLEAWRKYPPEDGPVRNWLAWFFCFANNIYFRHRESLKNPESRILTGDGNNVLNEVPACDTQESFPDLPTFLEMNSGLLSSPAGPSVPISKGQLIFRCLKREGSEIAREYGVSHTTVQRYFQQAILELQAANRDSEGNPGEQFRYFP